MRMRDTINRSKRSVTILATLCLLLSVEHAQAQRLFDYGFEFSTVGTTGMNFLKMGGGARSAGLAMTGTGLVGQAENLFHNPAGIAFLSRSDITFTTYNWFAGSVYNGVAMATPVGGIVLGMTLIDFRISKIEETTVMQPLGTGNLISAGDLQIGLSMARRFTDKLGIGGQIKVVRETLAEYTTDNVLIDLGATYFMGWQDMRVSFTFQHFGPDLKVIEQTLRMPLIFRVGLGLDLLEGNNSNLLLLTELSHPIDNLEQFSIAMEYALMDRFYGRAGWRMFLGGDDDLLEGGHRSTDEETAVYGFGIKVTERMRIDYALNPHRTALGSIHHFSAGFSF